MRKYAFIALAFTFAFAHSVSAQPSKPAGIGLNGIFTKVFADNNTFTADLVIKETVRDQVTSMPGKIAVNSGQIRMERNLGDAKSPQMRPENAEHLKAMGLDKTVDISRPDKKVAYFLYPNLSAYVETPLHNADTKPDTALKMKVTELGKETLDGHPCVKNKVVITDDEGTSNESTVWNATDLKKFPIKIETAVQGHTTSISFSNVKTGKPDAALFELPASYKKYDTRNAIMVEQMRKQMGTNMPVQTNHLTMPTNHP